MKTSIKRFYEMNDGCSSPLRCLRVRRHKTCREMGDIISQKTGIDFGFEAARLFGFERGTTQPTLYEAVAITAFFNCDDIVKLFPQGYRIDKEEDDVLRPSLKKIINAIRREAQDRIHELKIRAGIIEYDENANDKEAELFSEKLQDAFDLVHGEDT